MSKKLKQAALFLLISALLSVPAKAAADPGELNMEFDPADVDEAIFLDDDSVTAASIDVSAPSAILIEKETGEVIFEKKPDEKLLPASVTKIMTILLIAEAVESGRISLDDTVTTSAYAASMGGSQVFLEEGEQMPASEMLKCIVVSSANDAAVAMAEHIAGSEESFTELMNEKAKALGMENSHFTNCTGLLENDDHYTSARDIALMSRALLKYDWIKTYTTIWMDTIRNGEFGLSNTNKLIYYYKGSTGLKTGFTQRAGFCLSASAERDGMELIAVVMHCDTSQNRFESAKAMLNYGFANYTLIDKTNIDQDLTVKVKLGKEDSVTAVPVCDGSMLIPKSAASSIKYDILLTPEVKAPVTCGQVLGTLSISDNGEVLEEIELVASKDVAGKSWWDIFRQLLSAAFTGVM